MIKRLISKLKNKETVRNITKLTSGSVISMSLSVLTAPILYRIYEKADYGTLGMYVAITGVIGVFSTFEYPKTILIVKKESTAKVGMWLVRMVNFLYALFITLLILLFGEWLCYLLEAPEVYPWLFMIPFSLFFNAQSEVLRTWANRKKRYSILTLNTIITAISIPAVSISLGLLIEGPLGLFIGLLTSQVLPTIILYFSLSKYDNIGFMYFSFSRMKELASTYRNFPIYNMPSEFINRFTVQLPVFMLSKFAGLEVVGVYNLCVRMLGLPINVIGNSISLVFQQKASQSFIKKGEFNRIFKKTTKALVRLAILPLIILIIFGEELFVIAFGEEWAESGVLAQILSGMYIFKFIVSPLSYAFVIRNKLKEDMVYHAWMLLSNVLVFYLGFMITGNYKTVIFLYALNYMSIYILYYIRSFKFSKG